MRPEISERQLRSIWQRFHSPGDALRTADGRSLRVISPGTPNEDGGPDFSNASICIGGLLFRGDVELHVRADEWIAHGHHRDPHYNSVVLHVACAPSRSPARTLSGRDVPLLLVPHHLVASDNRLPELVTCPGGANPFDSHISTTRLRATLWTLGLNRLARNVHRMEERLLGMTEQWNGCLRGKSVWEQLLYEGLMDGMGYAKNRRPFVALAENVPITLLRRLNMRDTHTMLAVLFGAAGLLPSTRRLGERESRVYVRNLRRTWRTVRPSLAIPLLHEAQWQFFRLRPANFPTARLAAMCHLLPRFFENDGLTTLIDAFRTNSGTPRRIHRVLQEFFRFTPDAYWSCHLSFAHPSPRTGIAIGRARADEIIINTIIPLVLLLARIFRRPDIEHHAILLYRTLPATSPNSLTLQVQRCLRPTLPRLSTALLNQGVLDLCARLCNSSTVRT